MKLENARMIANQWIRNLGPLCDRIAIAGSIRREKPEVKDIELLCIPSVLSGNDLFDNSYSYRAEEFIQFFNNKEDFTVVTGDPRKGKYLKILLNDYQIKIDLFIADADNWGYLFAIRTGSADYSHKVLAHNWVKKGYHGAEGYLMKGKTKMAIREERELFQLIGVEYVEPKYREVNG